MAEASQRKFTENGRSMPGPALRVEDPDVIAEGDGPAAEDDQLMAQLAGGVGVSHAWLGAAGLYGCPSDVEHGF